MARIFSSVNLDLSQTFRLQDICGSRRTRDVRLRVVRVVIVKLSLSFLIDLNASLSPFLC